MSGDVSVLGNLPKVLTWDDYIQRMRFFGTYKRRYQMAIGWTLCAAERTFGEKYVQAAHMTGYDPNSLRNMKYVASRIGPDEYTDALTFSEWQALAPLERKDRDDLVTWTLAGNLTRDDLRHKVAERLGKVNGNGKVAQKPPNAKLEAFAEALAPVAEATRELLAEDTPAHRVALARSWDELTAAAVAMFEGWER